ncbi:hypothetical protein L6452_28630 [Arctium lappa]|uniref:Uncharacterized protein n=1 Tax=Arctium lappa TaxID=4217 RepID=A0ACB8ZY09_ARCLA|nr:hypothetical protein L6452_28630 [Arctium lappa]
MDSRSQLDYALFQLTPTRTRCDLVICAGDCKEKLASGLLEPFVAHLKFAKDQISKGGYSITLSASASWFTKSTLQRFVRFVNTPEVLERFITIEGEIANIDCSINTSASSDSQTVYGFEEHLNKSATSGYKHEGNTSDDIHEEDSKNRIHLQRVLETRKAVLQKEQAMVYARAIVAGFETDNLEDLICFADAFGSPRLREACLNFMELCDTKSKDRVWMDEVAAMQASSHSQYSYLGTSGGIILPEEDDPSQELRINVQNGNFATKKQNGAVDGSHLPQYMHSYQSGLMFQPPNQGYPFPGMVGPPYYQGNLPWSPNVEDFRRRGKRSQTKRSRELKQDGKFDSSDSSSGSDLSSSRKVVIRNINYISSAKDGEAEWVSDDNSSNGAVTQNLDRTTVEDKPEDQKVTTQQWDTFQVLLMKDADDKVPEEVKKPHTSDPFILVERDLIEENNDHVRNLKSREDLSPFVSHRFEETNISPSRILPEIATKSSTIEGHQGDWFLGSIPDIQEKSRDIFEDHFKSVESTKDVLVDDPLAVQARSLNELSDSQLRTQDILMVSESNLTQKAPYSPKKKVEAERINEPSDLYVVLERDTSGQQAMAVWTPEMELGNSNDKIVKLDSAEEGLERKGSTIEAKSKPLVGSLGKSKSDIISRSKKSTGTKTTILKGKSEKEEEKRKKMEELLIQRQKRIADRSAATAKTAKNDKPKAELASRGMKRSNKPVIRSSTIDRLSAARVVNPKVLPTGSKPGNKPTKVTTKENGDPKPAKKPMKVTTKENGESKPSKKPMNVTTKENDESKPAKKPMEVITKENGRLEPGKKPAKVITKENGGSKPAKKPTKVITKENGASKPGKKPTNVTTKNGISSTVFSQRTVGAGKREVKPQKVEHLDKNIGLKNSNGPKKKSVVLTNAKQLPRTSPIKKIGNGVARIGLSAQSDSKKGVSETLHKKASSVLQEDIALSGGNNGSANKALNSVSFSISEDIGAKERRVVKVNDETVVMEISTPPPGKGSPERSNSRKKWSSIGTSNKALSGFRKLLSFGRRS